MAVAVFAGQNDIRGTVEFIEKRGGLSLVADVQQLPPGDHGFHIHKAGDLRGEGCKGACDHFHKGPAQPHGGPPSSKAPRHTGDLGNITGPKSKTTYFLPGLLISDLYGRSVIVHADPDDLGKGTAEDSTTTGHSGARIGCALIGRIHCNTNKTRKNRA